MNVLLRRYLQIALLLLSPVVTLPASAYDYQFEELSAPAIYLPAAQRNVFTADAAGRLFVLSTDGMWGKKVAVRNAAGAWGPETGTSINPYLVINEFVMNPNTGNPIVFGVEPVAVDEDMGETPYSILVSYEYIGSTTWSKVVYRTVAEDSPAAFDYDESGVLHYLYRNLVGNELYYGRYPLGGGSVHAVTSLPSESYSEFEIQASSNGDQPIFATVYEPGGFVYTSTSEDGGASWSFVIIVDYGFTAMDRVHNLSTELGDDQLLHVFYWVNESGYIRTRYRSVGIDRAVSLPTTFETGVYGWHVLMHDGRPHYIYSLGFQGELTVEYLTPDGWEHQVVRSSQVFGDTVGATSHDGHLLLLASNPAKTERLFDGTPIIPPLFTSGFEHL